MSDYSEHLISMAGGDGEAMTSIVIKNNVSIEAVPLEVIAARQRNCRTYNFGMRDANSLAHHDVPHLLSLVSDQQAALDRVAELANWAGKHGWTLDAAAIRAALEPTK